MAEQWIEEDARLAKEYGWRIISSANGPAKGSWAYAFTTTGVHWPIRCQGEGEYWLVPSAHHWGYPVAEQKDVQGPFASFLAAAATYQLTTEA